MVFELNGASQEEEMGRFGLAVVLALNLAVVSGSAHAAQPANQACLGRDVSGYAKTFRPWGQSLKTFAVTEGGVGTDVQMHMAGDIPDADIPNTCND